MLRVQFSMGEMMHWGREEGIKEGGIKSLDKIKHTYFALALQGGTEENTG